MPTIKHEGIHLAYSNQGSGTPAFVFVHGWTCDRTFFASQVAYFTPRHRVVTVDLRGHGESDKPTGPYPITAYAEDLAYLIRHLALGQVIAVGHSMGGVAVLQLATTHPDCVAAIVMLDPASFVRPPAVRARLEVMVAAIEAGDQTLRREFLARHMFLPTSDKQLVEKVTGVMLAVPNHVAAQAMRGILAFDGPAVAAQCTTPALHIAATPPRNPPHLMEQWLPHVVTGWTVGAGHFNFLEATEQVNAMIVAFLRHYVSPA